MSVNELSRFRLDNMRTVSRLVDASIALCALIASSPLLLIAAIGIKLTSPGPILYRAPRIARDRRRWPVASSPPAHAFERRRQTGYRGHEFTAFKFRTMRVDAGGAATPITAWRDPRVFPFGHWLRATKIDELPQLLNVLLGQMSLVGPRPLPATDTPYEGEARRRLFVKPGLTGLWQISGRADLDWDEAVRLDLRYVENWSLALDALIIWKTLFVVLKRSGAY